MYNGRVKTLVLRAAFVAIPFVIVACHYGMTIRQLNSPERVSQGSSTKDHPQIVVNVETAERLISNISYFTGVKLTNVYGASIAVYNIDLLEYGRRGNGTRYKVTCLGYSMETVLSFLAVIS